MNVALGLKAHSGWAALVIVGRPQGALVVFGRRRVPLVDEAWARQPYHAAEHLEPEPARALVARAIDTTRRLAVDEIRGVIAQELAQKRVVKACAVLVGTAMPDWTVDEILAVHFRMHKAEGVLFRDALARAASECGVRLVAIPEQQLNAHAVRTLATPLVRLTRQITALGKSVGPPWGKDQKDAALAALVALEGRVR